MTGIARAIPLKRETRMKVVKFSVGFSATRCVTLAGTMSSRMMSTEKKNAITVVITTVMAATMSRFRSSPRCWTRDSSLSRAAI